MEEEVRSVLIDGKVLLQFALASIIEAIRRNPDKNNNLLLSDTLSPRTLPAQQSLSSHIVGYKEMILDKANRLYDSLLHHLTNSIMDNIGGSTCSSNPTQLSPQSSCTFPNLANQNDTHRKEESESYYHSKGDISD